VNGISVRSFSVQPDSLGNCVTDIVAAPTDVCLANGNLPGDIHYDGNDPRTGRTATDPRTRLNIFSNLTHTFDNGHALKVEASYYRAELENVRSDGNNSLSAYPIYIPA